MAAAGSAHGGYVYTNGYPVTPQLADLNRDNKLDLVLATSGGRVHVYPGDGRGGFGTRSDYHVGGYASAVAVGHFDRDSVPDLAVTTSTSGGYRLQVLRNNGDGTFVPGQAVAVSDITMASLAVGDIDRNGKQDLLVSLPATDSVMTLLGNGDATFRIGSQITSGIGRTPREIKVADLNLDARPDFVVTNASSNTVSVGLGDGRGGFRVRQFTAGRQPVAVDVGDVNLDGKPDLVTANSDSDDVSVLIGNGDGTFQSKQDSLAGDPRQVEIYPTDIALADFNRDGALDALVGHAHPLNIYRGTHVSLLLGTPQSAAVTYRFSQSGYTVGEGVGMASVTVYRSGDLSRMTQVQVGTVPLSAVPNAAQPGLDYVSRSEVLTFAPGEANKTFSFQILEDRLGEGTEAFGVELRTWPGQTADASVFPAGNVAGVSIADNDRLNPGTFQFPRNGYSYDRSTRTFTVTVERVGGSDGTVDVAIGALNDPRNARWAKQGVDYAWSGVNLRFEPGVVRKTFAVQVTSFNARGKLIPLYIASVSAGAQVGTQSSLQLKIG